MPRIAAALALIASAALSAPGFAQSFHTQSYAIGGDGGTDYLTAEPATGRVFISRGTHVTVVDGMTGKVVGDIGDTPRVHGIAFAPKSRHGFTTNAGDSTVTMFDMGTLAVIRKIKAGKDGLDGIMYDEVTDRILSINHSKPMGTAVVIDATTGDVVSTITLSGVAPEGGASDGKGKIYINIEDKNAIDVIDTKTWTLAGTMSIEPCDGPTGIAYDRASNRIFAGCSKTSVVVDPVARKVVAQIANGDGVDALGWDAKEKLIYLPAGQSGNLTVVHQDGPDSYRVVATVPTIRGAKTVAVDEAMHMAYVFAVQRGPSTPAAAPGQRPTPGPVTGTTFISVTH